MKQQEQWLCFSIFAKYYKKNCPTLSEIVLVFALRRGLITPSTCRISRREYFKNCNYPTSDPINVLSP